MPNALIKRLIEQQYIEPSAEFSIAQLRSHFHENGISVDESNGKIFLKKIKSPLVPEIIESLLSTIRNEIPFTVEVLQLIESTNNYLKIEAKTAELPLISLAEHQTNGHGRRGNSWISSYGEDICCSLAWEMPSGYQLSGAESLIIALTLAGSFEKMGIEGVQVKWPNDIYVKGKKISGILLEQIYSEGRAVLILGIGINVVDHFKASNQAGFSATSIENEINLYDRNKIAALVIEDMLKTLKTISPALDNHSMARWGELDYLRGKSIAINQITLLKGKYLGIDKNGRLLLKCEGEIKLISSGHITEIHP